MKRALLYAAISPPVVVLVVCLVLIAVGVR